MEGWSVVQSSQELTKALARGALVISATADYIVCAKCQTARVEYQKGPQTTKNQEVPGGTTNNKTKNKKGQYKLTGRKDGTLEKGNLAKDFKYTFKATDSGFDSSD